MACSVGRHKILLGKYCGAILILGIPLLVGLLINLIIIICSDVVEIGARDWIRILCIMLVSYLYLSIIVWLGMFVSSRSASPATSMVVLLLIWVGLVILFPSLGRIAADRYDRDPGQIPIDPRLKLSHTSTSTEADAQSQRLKEYVDRMIA